ncbi:MAG: radical SAM protein [Actinomycetota bacterium]
MNDVEVSTAGIFKDAIKIALANPFQVMFFIKAFKWQKHAAARRKLFAKSGITVPPVIIFSITKKCNLNCKGCYDKLLRPNQNGELTSVQIKNLFSQSRDMGISFFVIVGGEPLVRTNLLEITQDFKDMVFLIFTNGTLFTKDKIEKFKKQKNLFPVLSLEGYSNETDNRRGPGVFGNLLKVMENLKESKIFFGVSLTINKNNFATLLNEEFVSELSNRGCNFYLYIEYTPVAMDTEELVLTQEQRIRLDALMDKYRKKYSPLFMAVPSEEEKFGGCLSAGRGFIHINAQGGVEPCPFAPYSDINIKETPLRDALKSPLLKKIRDNGENICNNVGGCSLWANKDWVCSLLK